MNLQTLTDEELAEHAVTVQIEKERRDKLAQIPSTIKDHSNNIVATISRGGVGTFTGLTSGGQAVVKDNDTRLSNARTPTAHNHNDLYYTKAEIDAMFAAL